MVNPHKSPHSAPKDHQPAPSSPTLDSNDVHSQNCETEPSPPAPPSIHTSIHSTVDRCLSQDRKKTIPITGFRSSPLREADEALPGPLDTTGFGDEPTQPAQHDQNDPNLANRSSNALSNDQNLNEHRQAVDDSSELSKSMQVWMIEPTISKAEDHNGYDIRWYKYILPLSLSEFKDESRDFRRHFWQKKKSLREQFANLSHQERHVLHYFLNEGKSGIPGDPVTITMKSIKFMKMRPAREPITRMPWRCIHVLIEDDAAVEDRHSTRDSDEWQRIHPRPPHRQMLEPFQPPRPRYDAQHHAQYLPHQQIQGHIPVAARHHSHEPQLGYPRHQHQLDHHPHHDLGDEIFPVEDFVPREDTTKCNSHRNPSKSSRERGCPPDYIRGAEPGVGAFADVARAQTRCPRGAKDLIGIKAVMEGVRQCILMMKAFETQRRNGGLLLGGLLYHSENDLIVDNRTSRLAPISAAKARRPLHHFQRTQVTCRVANWKTRQRKIQRPKNFQRKPRRGSSMTC